MVKVFCDKCNADCGLNAFVLTVQTIHNPNPVSPASFGRIGLTDDISHVTLCLCQKCYGDMKLPNIYSCVKTGKIVWGKVTGAASSGGAQPNCERSNPEKPVKSFSPEYSSR
jgi:hypothetical protein